jgi:hypothetical protein
VSPNISKTDANNLFVFYFGLDVVCLSAYASVEDSSAPLCDDYSLMPVAAAKQALAASTWAVTQHERAFELDAVYARSLLEKPC